MMTSMNKNNQETKSPVGLLLIIGDISSDEQRDEICIRLKQAFKQIDCNKYHQIIDIFNNLIHENEFQIGLSNLIILNFYLNILFISNRLSISTNS